MVFTALCHKAGAAIRERLPHPVAFPFLWLGRRRWPWNSRAATPLLFKANQESAVAKARQKSYGDQFWTFVTENPELAATIAFEIGAVAGKLTSGVSMKRLSKLPPNFSNITNAVPQLAQAALKYLPGTSPSIQPAPGRVRKARRTSNGKTSRTSKSRKSP